MKNPISFFILFFLSIIITNSYGQTTDIGSIITRLNDEGPAEPGCEKKEFSYNDCSLSCLLVCNGNEFNISFSLDDIGRVYKDKADFDDLYETLFFECRKGKNCVKSDSEMIPPSPVFPVRLPEDPQSTLGEEALKAFGALIEKCK